MSTTRKQIPVPADKLPPHSINYIRAIQVDFESKPNFLNPDYQPYLLVKGTEVGCAILTSRVAATIHRIDTLFWLDKEEFQHFLIPADLSFQTTTDFEVATTHLTSLTEFIVINHLKPTIVVIQNRTDPDLIDIWLRLTDINSGDEIPYKQTVSGKHMRQPETVPATMD